MSRWGAGRSAGRRTGGIAAPPPAGADGRAAVACERVPHARARTSTCGPGTVAGTRRAAIRASRPGGVHRRMLGWALALGLCLYPGLMMANSSASSLADAVAGASADASADTAMPSPLTPTVSPGAATPSSDSGPMSGFTPPVARCPPPLPTAPAGPPIDRGMLWQLERDGRISWLYGTVHLGRPEWALLGPRVSAALVASEVLALEIDPHDPAVHRELAAEARPEPLPPALAQRLDRALHGACATGLALGALHPLLQASTLLLLDARWLGLDPNYALEVVLSLRARAAGMPVIALETAARQMQALVPPAPTAMHVQLAQTLQQLEDGSARRSVQRLTVAWESGDLQALGDPATWCDCEPGVLGASEADFLVRINDARNPALATAIAARHAGGQRVFAAVGALHMTGPAALQHLLADQGFRVERVVFDRPAGPPVAGTPAEPPAR
jgi:uncharacterized protein